MKKPWFREPHKAGFDQFVGIDFTDFQIAQIAVGSLSPHSSAALEKLETG
ncbi:hypothetical protein [Persicobacter diffluens]